VGALIGSKFETGTDRTIFMDTYAMQAKWHMWKYGTTRPISQPAPPRTTTTVR